MWQELTRLDNASEDFICFQNDGKTSCNCRTWIQKRTSSGVFQLLYQKLEDPDSYTGLYSVLLIDKYNFTLIVHRII